MNPVIENPTPEQLVDGAKYLVEYKPGFSIRPGVYMRTFVHGAMYSDSVYANSRPLKEVQRCQRVPDTLKQTQQ